MMSGAPSSSSESSSSSVSVAADWLRIMGHTAFLLQVVYLGLLTTSRSPSSSRGTFDASVLSRTGDLPLESFPSPSRRILNFEVKTGHTDANPFSDNIQRCELTYITGLEWSHQPQLQETQRCWVSYDEVMNSGCDKQNESGSLALSRYVISAFSVLVMTKHESAFDRNTD